MGTARPAGRTAEGASPVYRNGSGNAEIDMSEPQQAPENPYQAPSAPGLFSTWQPTYFSAQAEAGVTPRIVEMLARTQPWVRFLSVLGFIGFALLMVAALGALLIGATRSNPGGILVAIIWVAAAVVYLLPSVFLSRYASDIARLRASLRVQDLEEALASQKSFWKFMGIATLLMLILYVPILLVVLATSGPAVFMPSTSSF
jgi:hypothetical protein